MKKALKWIDDNFVYILVSTIFFLILFTSCDKENDLIQDKITISISVQKLWLADNQFNNETGKSCTFPDTFAPVDSETYYIILESLDGGETQTIIIADGAGSFTFTNYGDNYKVTTSTSETLPLPLTGDDYYWYTEQTIDLAVSRSVDIVLENPYSAIVVINNENTIKPTPTLSGEPLYVKEDGWFIFSRVEGVEPVSITKWDDSVVSLNTSYEPAQIFTYMYCEPLSMAISKATIPFTINNNIQIN